MFSGHSIHLGNTAVAITLLVASATVFAAPQTNSLGLSLSTQRGISGGRSGGTELETAPLSQQKIGVAQPAPTSGTLPGNGSAIYPYIVVPYAQLPGVAPTPRPQPLPRPMPRLP